MLEPSMGDRMSSPWNSGLSSSSFSKLLIPKRRATVLSFRFHDSMNRLRNRWKVRGKERERREEKRIERGPHSHEEGEDGDGEDAVVASLEQVVEVGADAQDAWDEQVGCVVGQEGEVERDLLSKVVLVKRRERKKVEMKERKGKREKRNSDIVDGNFPGRRHEVEPLLLQKE